MLRWFGAIALAVVLVIPFLLRPRDNLFDRSGEPLVVLTPHNEAIRYEFARAFRAHMRDRYGRAVRIDWRTPGGTNEIARFMAGEYASAFEIYWKHRLGRPWTPSIAGAFANPGVREDEPGPDERDRKLARREFLGSDVGIGADLYFGGGSQSSIRHAQSGYLVDSGFVRAHPEIFNDQVIPPTIGGSRFWDEQGRWVGTCLTGFGICYNTDALARHGLAPPKSWLELGDPIFMGQLAVADPSKSGSAVSAFDMLIQEQMNRRAAELGNDATLAPSEIEQRATHEGWRRAMQLIRRIGANARYFTDAAPKIAIDIGAGDATAGMCIDFYGRFQSEMTASHGGEPRVGFVMPRGGSAIDSDPIALLRGAPHRELALKFIDFVLSVDGQKLWDFKLGTPGGPQRYALRRLPILPALYDPAFEHLRADPEERPFELARMFQYHPARTAPLLRAIAFIIRVMCVETEDDLATAWRELAAHGFPPRAAALFEDVDTIDYAAAAGPIRAALSSANPADEVALGNRLIAAFRRQYREVAALARGGK